MNYSTSIVGTTFVESLLWPPTAFLQTLWEQPFPQSLWEHYTLTNHAPEILEIFEIHENS